MSERTQLAELSGLQGNLVVDLVESDALRNNALGDPSRRHVAVYTPQDYDAEGSRRYPTLYCLHGYTGNVAWMLALRPWERNVVQRMDALVQEKKIPPAMLVLVDGFTRLGGSQYVNSIHNGDYSTYVVRDVIRHVDGHYRTIAREGGRAVFGKSSGGFGAMHLAMEHPGVFAAFASHSGDSYFRYSHTMSFPNVQRTLERHGYDVAAFVGAFESKPKRRPDEYVTMEMLGYAAAYSPREAKPFAVDLPFDLKTGELRDDVFARWLAFDPVERIASRLEPLRSLRLRYVECGRRDEYALDIGARIVSRRLLEAGMTVRHEEFDDTHGNTTYRYDISIPALIGVLDRE